MRFDLETSPTACINRSLGTPLQTLVKTDVSHPDRTRLLANARTTNARWTHVFLRRNACEIYWTRARAPTTTLSAIMPRARTSKRLGSCRNRPCPRRQRLPRLPRLPEEPPPLQQERRAQARNPPGAVLDRKRWKRREGRRNRRRGGSGGFGEKDGEWFLVFCFVEGVVGNLS